MFGTKLSKTNRLQTTIGYKTNEQSRPQYIRIEIPWNSVNTPWPYIRTKDKFDGPLFRGRLIYGRAYIWDEKHFNLQSVKLITFLSFFQYKARILGYLTSCKMWKMFKVNNKGTRIPKVNNEVNNKDTLDVVLVSLLLNLNTFHFLLQCFYCWLWSVNCWRELLLVVLTLCVCWNQFRQSFHLQRNKVNKLHWQNEWKHFRKSDIFNKVDV